MSNFTDALSRYYDSEHLAVAAIVEVQTNGYRASTASEGKAILLTSSVAYAVNDSIFYNVKTREIVGKAPDVTWSEIQV